MLAAKSGRMSREKLPFLRASLALGCADPLDVGGLKRDQTFGFLAPLIVLEMKLLNYLNWLNIKVVKCFVHKRRPGCS